MPQVDLILETYVHASAEIIAPWISDPRLPSRLWPRWRLELRQERGLEGMRWALNDPVGTGTTEVWVEAIASDGCVLHTYTRVDRREGRWSRCVAAWHRERVRARQVRQLWRLKDDVERAVAEARR